MFIFDDETLVVYSKSLKDFCDSLEIMEKINSVDGIDFCHTKINTLVGTLTTYGHLGKIKELFQSNYDEKYLQIIDNAYAYNQSQTLLKMCKSKNNSGEKEQTTDEDIFNFLSNVNQAGLINEPIASIGGSLDQQKEDMCPFEPHFKTGDEYEHYHLLLNNYEYAKYYVNSALAYQNEQTTDVSLTEAPEFNA